MTEGGEHEKKNGGMEVEEEVLVTLLGETTRRLARGELHARARLFADDSSESDARRRRQHPPDDALICADSAPPASFSLAASFRDTSHHGVSDFGLNLTTV